MFLTFFFLPINFQIPNSGLPGYHNGEQLHFIKSSQDLAQYSVAKLLDTIEAGDLSLMYVAYRLYCKISQVYIPECTPRPFKP